MMLRTLIALMLLALLALHAPAWSQSQASWRPDKPVEIIVPTGASGINDPNARLLQKSFQDLKLLPTPTLVNNKPGGNQSLAVVQLMSLGIGMKELS